MVSSEKRQYRFEQHFRPASKEGWRWRWYRIIFHHEQTREQRFDLLLIVAIFGSVGVVLMDSLPGLSPRSHLLLLYIAEWAFTLLFSVEYIMRLLVVSRPIRYATSFFGVIDLLAIVPTYLSLLLVGSNYLAVVRVLRLLRVFRVLKLAEYSSEGGMLIEALVRSRRKVFVFLCALLTIVVIFAALMYLVEGPEHGFHSIPEAMYWAVVTMTTVGYGDITPGTPLGRFITSVLVLIGYSIIAVPTGIYTAELAKGMRPQRLESSCPSCSLPEHESDSLHCRRCGHTLPGPD
ncbi:MAG: ion transporter [Lysobacteraceae bacterium]